MSSGIGPVTTENSNESEPIPVETLAHHRRATCRRAAVAIATLMADTDVGFPEMAKRLRVREKTVRKWFGLLLDGQSFPDDIGCIGTMMFACGGAKPVFRLRRIRPHDAEMG